MGIQQTTPISSPIQGKKKRFSRRTIVATSVILGIVIATFLSLSSLSVIPGYVAIIITSFCLVFGVIFTLLAIIPPDDKLDMSVSNSQKSLAPPVNMEAPKSSPQQAILQPQLLPPSDYHGQEVSLASTSLPNWKRIDLEQRRDEILRLRDIRNKKVQRLQEALAIETDVNTTFKYEQQISQEQAALASLNDEMNAIEHQLQ